MLFERAEGEEAEKVYKLSLLCNNMIIGSGKQLKKVMNETARYESLLDTWSEKLFREYGEYWVSVLDEEECNKKISEFFKRSNQ